jgi:hypothetical protein
MHEAGKFGLRNNCMSNLNIRVEVWKATQFCQRVAFVACTVSVDKTSFVAIEPRSGRMLGVAVSGGIRLRLLMQ